MNNSYSAKMMIQIYRLLLIAAQAAVGIDDTPNAKDLLRLKGTKYIILLYTTNIYYYYYYYSSSSSSSSSSLSPYYPYYMGYVICNMYCT